MQSKVKLLILMLLAASPAMAQKTAADAKPGEVIVKGKVGNLNAPRQLWIYMGDEKWDTIPVKNGEFEYRKKTLLPAYGAIMVKYSPYYPGVEGPGFFSDMSLASVFFETGTMTINAPADTLRTGVQIAGSSLNAKHREFWSKEGALVREQKKLAAVFNNAAAEQLQSEAYLQEYERKNEVILMRWDSLILAEVKKYPDSYHTVMAFYGYIRQRKPDSTAAIVIAGQFGELYKEQMRSYVRAQSAETTVRIPVAPVGSMAPDFVQNNMEGKPVRLSGLRNKYVLIDFWASWCGPCRKVNPDLVKLYRQFKGPKFEILGVSLDQDAAKWEAAVEEDQLAWLHVSDLKGWKNEVAQQYDIGAIPQNLLLDPSGKVVARNLKIDELEDQLNNLLK
ncbi:TlpA disulfide reductase family protein [Chitinophaga sp. XS-30]|uniref:TlpA disulfide reductase family protein n=1 Tax=Chitinophaga sp. XS-30 TaxID=2604421 RepID=UPI0011DC9CDA|nr:TlpA disulfide reductase family protein [Chitinophaga sp. XS-30]QEH43272.1 AhpC/TSA family protein [Chitinophaga sp. XS-30]